MIHGGPDNCGRDKQNHADGAAPYTDGGGFEEVLRKSRLAQLEAATSTRQDIPIMVAVAPPVASPKAHSQVVHRNVPEENLLRDDRTMGKESEFDSDAT